MPDPMTPERLAEIEKRANCATEGPWWLAHPGLIYGKDPHHEGYAQAVTKADLPDAEFIAAARRFPDVEVTNNNEADALVLAAMGARHLGRPIDDMPKSHLTALDAVRWPEGTL